MPPRPWLAPVRGRGGFLRSFCVVGGLGGEAKRRPIVMGGLEQPNCEASIAQPSVLRRGKG